MSGPAVLVCARLTAMTRVHPEQDNSHVCSACGEPVGIYPSGQRCLKAYPEAKIVCSVCAIKDMRPSDINEPCAPWADIVEEMRSSKPMGRA